MRFTIITALLFIFSCQNEATDNSETNNNTAEVEVSSKPVSKISNTQEASKVDSSYANFWCSIETLKKIEPGVKEGDLVAIARLLATIHESCDTNVEFSQWSNELLFNALATETDGFLGVLHKNNSLQKESILKELKNPIHDEFDIEKLKNKVKNSSTPNEIKEAVVKALSQD